MTPAELNEAMVRTISLAVLVQKPPPLTRQQVTERAAERAAQHYRRLTGGRELGAKA